ncbi:MULTISPECIES: hypothetical protein [Mesorhizobium]|uniref:hypothetical protein n=1 Tax=Mesorhizobium TaxID=68287 RepID=UPI0003CE2E35|nr:MULTISPECIES: hypothetical protein [Mesorhizobium]ESY62935.1 hypothetical protein X742_31105 [Mesorhizobium sp. LNHC232B00]WJI36445.1 hypothetical protein NL534_21395 [Mesorhizobium opportunistum]
MQNNRRQFYIFDLELAARKAGATVPTMNDIVPVLQQMHTTARIYSIRSQTATMLIGDIDVDAAQQFVTLLIRLSDTSAPNSVYSDPASGHFTEHVKTGSVGSDYGCHVLISTAPEQGLPNIYTCAIERIPGLPFDLTQRLLSKLLNYEFHDNPLSFSYPHPAGGLNQQGQPRTDRCCPHVELRGRPSNSLINDINNGSLSGITLVKAETVTPIAGAAFLTKSKSELKLEIDHNNLPANLWNSLKNALHLNSTDYGTAKVTYKIPSSTRTVTVEIATSTGTPLTDLYVMNFELINVFPFLAQSAKNVVAHLRDAAAPHFLANRTI